MNKNQIKTPYINENSFAYIKKIRTRSKIIYLSIALLVIVTFSLLPFIYVDVSIQSQGIIQANIKRQPITVPFTGKLLVNNLKENGQVTSNDTLLLFDVSAQKASYTYNKQRISILTNEIADLNKLVLFDSTYTRKKYKLLSPSYSYDYESFIQILNSLKRKANKQRVDYERNRSLYESKVIAKSEYENYEFGYFQQLDEISTTVKRKRLEWQQSLQNATKELEQLNTEQTKLILEISNAAVKANINGVIQQCVDLQPGSILFANQQLAEITPTTKLQVECSIKPSDIGYIRHGQPIKFQVDALNYMEWGMVGGRISEISNDILTTNNQQIYFKAICSLDKDYLSLKNGYKTTLKKGMTVNARMLITQRSLYSLLFEKADKWLNPYTNTKNIKN